MVYPKNLKKWLLTLAVLFSSLHAEIVDRQGEGFLEKREEGYILHLKGSAYERGYQHGRLLQEMIQRNIATYIDKKQDTNTSRTEDFLKALPTLMKYVPAHFLEEMKGLSDGSGIPMQKIVLLNLFPEMFHCSGMTVSNEATKDHQLYHVRVLDYAIGKNLQKTAVLMVVEPTSSLPYLNVSYAGFIGSVTGMNSEKIAVGEIGGQGYGNWEGIPMAFLIREILEKAHSLEEAKQILSTSPRTCEYYYVLSDGKTNEGIGVYATSDHIHFISPGAPKDCLLLSGSPSLEPRINQQWGRLDAFSLMEVIRQPVSRPSNLHNAIFLPEQLTVWISHAGPNDEPACDQPYVEFSFPELLNARG